MRKGVGGHGHLQAGSADVAASGGVGKTADHGVQVIFGPGNPGEAESTGLALPCLGTEGAVHEAPAAQHQVGGGRRDGHGHVGQAQHGGGADGDVDARRFHGQIRLMGRRGPAKALTPSRYRHQRRPAKACTPRPVSIGYPSGFRAALYLMMHTCARPRRVHPVPVTEQMRWAGSQPEGWC